MTTPAGQIFGVATPATPAALTPMEGLLTVVDLEVTTEGSRTGTGTERLRERVPVFRDCTAETTSTKYCIRLTLVVCSSIVLISKSVLSLVSRLSGRRYQLLLLSAGTSIDSWCTWRPQGAQQQTSHTPLLLSISGTDEHRTVT